MQIECVLLRLLQYYYLFLLKTREYIAEKNFINKLIKKIPELPVIFGKFSLLYPPKIK